MWASEVLPTKACRKPDNDHTLMQNKMGHMHHIQIFVVDRVHKAIAVSGVRLSCCETQLTNCRGFNATASLQQCLSKAKESFEHAAWIGWTIWGCRAPCRGLESHCGMNMSAVPSKKFVDICAASEPGSSST